MASATSIDVTHEKSDELWEEIKVLRKIASGSIPCGIVPHFFDLDTLEERLKPDASLGVDTVDPNEIAMDIYRSAHYRDASYAQASRVMLRAAGLNAKWRTLYCRACAVNLMTGE